MIESASEKQATDAFMGLVEDQIDNLKQSLAEAGEKIRILQENAAALVDQKAELQQTIEIYRKQVEGNEAQIAILKQNNDMLTVEINRLQGMGIQQNTPDTFVEMGYNQRLGETSG